MSLYQRSRNVRAGELFASQIIFIWLDVDLVDKATSGNLLCYLIANGIFWLHYIVES